MFSMLSTAIGFLYPAYSSYKTLSKRPIEEAELERWVMYWSTLSVLLTTEYLLPLLFYVPFYSLFRALFLLFLVAPQTQGSTYLYRAYMEPFLREHEGEIDGLVGKAKERGWSEGRKWGGWAWERVIGSLGAQGAQAAQDAGAQPGAGIPVPPEGTVGASQPPNLASPLAGPAQMLGGLWRAYGPSLIASGATFVQNQQANLARARAAGASSTPYAPPSQPRPAEGYTVGAQGSTSAVSSRSQEALSQSNLAQRRAGGPPTPGGSSSSAPGPATPSAGFGTGPAFPVPEPPIPSPGQPSSSGHPSPFETGSGSGSGDERDRRYEKISHEDVEEHPEEGDKAQGGSWFPWSPASKGYERVKSE